MVNKILFLTLMLFWQTSHLVAQRADTTPPIRDSPSVSDSVWQPDGHNSYQITLVASDNSSGVRDIRALINYHGDNRDNQRGYFAWKATGYTFGNEATDQMPCTGGGYASKYGGPDGSPAGHGGSYVTLVGCSTSLEGSQRSVTFTLQPHADFGDFANNDISFWARDYALNNTGWKNYDLDFLSDASGPKLDSVTVPSRLWQPDGENTYQIILTANDAISGVRDMRALINLQGANSANQRGYFAWEADGNTFGNAAADLTACAGGGYASKYSGPDGSPAGHGGDHITLVACSTSLDLGKRTVVLTVRPHADFGKFSNNDVSLWARDHALNPMGWANYDLDFRSDWTGTGMAAATLPRLQLPPDTAANKRYLVDATTGDAVYLGGAHVWQNLQAYGPVDDSRATNCGIGLDNHACGDGEWQFLRSKGHNFTRGWHWEQAERFSGFEELWTAHPVPFGKDTNGDFDLETLDNDYLEHLKRRIEGAAAQGLYLSIMLFQGHSIQTRPNGADDSEDTPDDPWGGHPFNHNINNVPQAPVIGAQDVDQGGDIGGGEELHTCLIDSLPDISRLQKKYVETLVTALNEYDNIIWEICNECGNSTNNPSSCPEPIMDGSGGTTCDPARARCPEQYMDWMDKIVNIIKDTESELENQHLVWISPLYRTSQRGRLLASPADIISFKGDGNHDYVDDIPQNNDNRVVFLDSDHIKNPTCVGVENNTEWCSIEWPWKAFTRGYNPVLMDTVRTLFPANRSYILTGNSQYNEVVEETRIGIGQTIRFANEVLADLGATAPRQDLCQTGYCLANPGQEYLVFQPGSEAFWVDLQPGLYDYQWFDTDTDTCGPSSCAAVATGQLMVAAGDDAPIFPRSSDNLSDWDDWVLYVSRGDQPPVAVIDHQCSDLVCTFDARGSSDDFEIISYAWDFGDGASSSNSLATHTYGADDEYLVRLTVTDSGGQAATAELGLVVEEGDEMPMACFTASCTALVCTFDPACSNDDNGIENLSFTWDFGDGTTLVTGDHGAVTHTYASHGRYEVGLTVTDAPGEFDTASPQTVTAAAQVCTPGDTTLCLRAGRFRVEVDWTDFENMTGPGTAAEFGNDASGLFWFFSEANLEFMVKVLDGCSQENNPNFWVFASASTNVGYELRVTDTMTGIERAYVHTAGTAAPAITDTAAFSCEFPSDPLGPAYGPTMNWTPGPDPDNPQCTPSATTHCLHQGRFKVELQWRDFIGQTGSGQTVPYGTDESGLFYFFSEDNWEILVKVLNGCAPHLNQHYWVLGAATTNVEYTLTVSDLITGQVKQYLNPLGQNADAIIDDQAFASCP